MKSLLFCLSFFIPSLLWASSFDGSWKQDCQVVDDGDLIQVGLNISGDDWTWQGYGFEEANCKTPYIVYEETYSTKEVIATSDHEYDLNFATKEISYTPLSAEVAEALNEVGFCDIQTWKVNVKTSVTGKHCEDREIRKAGDAYFQKVSLADSSLLWGLVSETLDGSTEAKRPSTYESLPFKK